MAYYQAPDINKWEWIEAGGKAAAKIISQVVQNSQLRPKLTAEWLDKAAREGKFPTEADVRAGVGSKGFDKKTWEEWEKRRKPKTPPDGGNTSTNSVTGTTLVGTVPTGTPMDEQGWLPRESAADDTGSLKHGTLRNSIVNALVTPPGKVTVEDGFGNKFTEPPGTVVESTAPVAQAFGWDRGSSSRKNPIGSGMQKLYSDTTGLNQGFVNLASQTGVPVDYLYALAEQESSMNPRVEPGAAGELGMFQMLPSNLRAVGVDLSTPDKVEAFRNNPAAQFKAAADFINLEKRRFSDLTTNPTTFFSFWNGGTTLDKIQANPARQTGAKNVLTYLENTLPRLWWLQYQRNGQKPVEIAPNVFMRPNPNNPWDWEKVTYNG